MTSQWRVPRLWPGQTCFILGGGPSLKKIDVNRLRGEHVIAINNAYKLGTWIDVMFYGDCPWLDDEEHHRGDLRRWPGLKVTTCQRHDKEPGIHRLRKIQGRQNLSLDSGQLSWNLSSGAAAINLAYHFGVKRIVLLGYDMHDRNGLNWHPDHVFKDVNARTFKRYLTGFPLLAQSIAAQGVEVLNATPGSDLLVWPIVDPETVLPPLKVPA
jgi:hypothetical protein